MDFTKHTSHLLQFLNHGLLRTGTYKYKCRLKDASRSPGARTLRGHPFTGQAGDVTGLAVHLPAASPPSNPAIVRRFHYIVRSTEYASLDSHPSIHNLPTTRHLEVPPQTQQQRLLLPHWVAAVIGGGPVSLGNEAEKRSGSPASLLGTP